MVDEDTGTMLDTPKSILDAQKKFYRKLYSVDEDVDFTLQNTYGIYVPEEIRLLQNKPLEMIDLEQAIKLMKNSKTPGEDGIPIDFYKVFWCQIKSTFLDMMLQCLDEEKLHDTARSGILNLIPKADKDTRFVKNLRPITLLNTDYKIIEKAIAQENAPCIRAYYSPRSERFYEE